MKELFRKYNLNAPRYTSYPAVPYWNHKVDEQVWPKLLERGLSEDPSLDLYIHIPFCEKLCWYCGCNRVITKNKQKGTDYIQYIKKEFDLYLATVGELPIRSLHFGGGTPTFLTPEQLHDLLSHLEPHFFKNVFEGAIEVDPRTCMVEHLEILREFGFSRISFGIQDFDSSVQTAINRIQPVGLVSSILDKARSLGFEHVNFDLIWGLPKQTVETVRSTINYVKEMAPEQISYYSYAHLPERFKHQRLIKAEDILQGENKRALYDEGKTLLEKAGYVEIGMDHYAKKESLLANAFLEGKLQRNFMGYTDVKANNLLGLGASSISSNSFGFSQNLKSIEEYKNRLDANTLPIEGGHLNIDEDYFRANIIQNLMCNMKVNDAHVGFLNDHKMVKETLEDYIQDGLLEYTEGSYKVTPVGKMFIRVIAKAFDQYHGAANTKGKTFSKTV